MKWVSDTRLETDDGAHVADLTWDKVNRQWELAIPRLGLPTQHNNRCVDHVGNLPDTIGTVLKAIENGDPWIPNLAQAQRWAEGWIAVLFSVNAKWMAKVVAEMKT